MPSAPKFDPQRRNARVGPVKLPAEGRRGDVPGWPLDGPTCREEAVWGALWRTPQAVVWERLGWLETVARYCRLVVRCEGPQSGAGLHAAATALEDRLGLTPKAMRLLLWEVQDDELAEARRQPRSDVRRRIRAVD